MSKQTINIGTYPNDGTGDNLRDSFIKINNNFNEVYAMTGTTGNGNSGASGTSGVNGLNGTSGVDGTSNTGSTGSVVTNVTYNELSELINNSGLTINSSYLITDYQTVHVIPYTEYWNNLEIGKEYIIYYLFKTNNPDENSDDDFSNVGYVSDGVPFIATNESPNYWSDTKVFEYPNDYLSTGIIEPLLVTASGLNTLKPEAYSTLYPQDVIYYNHKNDQVMIPGCTKGYIYRRIDTLQNNDIPFDFRQAKFRRWQINVTNSWISGITYTRNSVVSYKDSLNIYICITNNTYNVDPSQDNEKVWKLFEWNNLSYISIFPDNLSVGNLRISCSTEYTDYNMWSDWSNYETAYSNIIQFPNSNIEILYNSNNVIFGSNFNSNSIGSNFYSNSIGSYFYSNSIGSYFNANSIGSDFFYNSIGSYFNSNSIGSYFNANSIGSDFYSNNIGSDFRMNNICSVFYYNSIGSNFRMNSIGSNFGYNSIGSNFNSNSIGSNFAYNSIGIDFYYNSIGSYFYYNSIGSNFINNSIGSNFRNDSIDSYFYGNTIGNFVNYNTIGSNFGYNSIGNLFQNNSIGSYFRMNNIFDSFSTSGGVDFSSSTHVYQSYTKELYVDSSGQQKLAYDRNTIVNANE